MGGRGSSGIRNSEGFNPNDYKKTDELYFLAKGAEYLHREEGAELRTISENGNKGFVAYKEESDKLHMEYLGSTGGHLGQKLMTYMADKAIQKNKDLAWTSMDYSRGYYSQLGLDEYSIDGSNAYRVKVSQLKDFRKRLNP